MAGTPKQFSDLPAAAALTGTEVVPIQQSGQTKKVTKSELLADRAPVSHQHPTATDIPGLADKVDRAGGTMSGPLTLPTPALTATGALAVTADWVRAYVAQVVNAQAGGTAPTVTTFPVIRVQGGGAAIPGAILEIQTAAVFGGSPTSTTRNWRANGGTPAGTDTGTTYTIQQTDVGKVMDILYTGIKAGFQTALAPSNGISAVSGSGTVLAVVTAPSLTESPVGTFTLGGDTYNIAGGTRVYEFWVETSLGSGSYLLEFSSASVSVYTPARSGKRMYGRVSYSVSGQSIAPQTGTVTIPLPTSSGGAPLRSDILTLRATRTSSGPITITEANKSTLAPGGVLSGKWFHNDAAGGGHLITVDGVTSGLVIELNEIGPNGPDNGDQVTEGIRCINGTNNVTIRRNTIHDVASGGSAYACGRNFEITQNLFFNIRGTFPRGQAWQWETCSGGTVGLGFHHNDCDGEYTIPGTALICKTEDWVSCYNTGGDDDTHRMLVHHNRFRGMSTISQNGSAVMLGDTGGSWVDCYSNIVVDVVNVGIGMSGGSNNKVRDNLVFMNNPKSALAYHHHSPGTGNTYTNNRGYCKDNLYNFYSDTNSYEDTGTATESGNNFGDLSLSRAIWDTWDDGGGSAPSAPATITFIGSSSAQFDQACARPDGAGNPIVANDFMLSLDTCNASTQTITPPAGGGWTQVGANQDNTVQTSAIYRRKAGSSEPSSYTWTYSDPNNVTRLLAWRGVNGTTPIDVTTGFTVTNGNAASPITLTSPSVTTVTANALVLWIAFLDHSSDGPGITITYPAGFTPRGLIENGSFCAIAIAEKIQAAAGATGTISGSAVLTSGTANCTTATVVLRPA